MRSFKLISSLILASLCFLGCDDDNDNGKSNKKDNDDTTDNPVVEEPTIKECNTTTYVDSCKTDSDTDIKVTCGKSSSSDVDHIKEVACPTGSKCSVVNNKAICTYEDACDENQENEVIDSSCSYNSYNDTEIVKYICTRTDTGSLIAVETREKCKGLCRNGSCYQVGDPCAEDDPSLVDSVLGCNGSNIFVCGKVDHKIHKEWCENGGLCRKSSDGYYYCAAKCDSEGKTSSICTITNERSISRTCQSVNGSKQLYLVANKSTKTSGSKQQYCKNGSLHDYPDSVSWKGQCTEYCYGNAGIPWVRDNGGDLTPYRCGVGKCNLQAGYSGSSYCDYSYCMQPCDTEGEIKVFDGNTISYTSCSNISYKCTKYNNGLYYKAIEDVQCWN